MEGESKKYVAKPVSWRAAEYEMIPKNMAWFLIIGVIALALIVLALFQRNFFFAFFIFVATAMVFVFARRRPNVLDFEINDRGVQAGTMSWGWDAFADFSIHSRPGRLDEIILRKNTSFNPYVRFPADDQTAKKVRLFIGERLPEVPYDISTFEIITDWFGI